VAQFTTKIVAQFETEINSYPPDLQDAAVQTVLKQAELICADVETDRI
jgi:hypothetical protein